MEPFLTTALKIVWLAVGIMILLAPFVKAF